MKQPLINKHVKLQTIEEVTDVLPSHREFGLSEDGAHDLQKGGRIEGLKVLNSFLYERGEKYTKEMSSPV
jgi:deoxyribodipyrimidine photo-lyase